MADRLWEVYALRYSRLDRCARQNFIDGDANERPMPMDYYTWAATNHERTIVVDTGFDRAGAGKRGKTLLRPVEEGLNSIGIDHEQVSDVVITHLHADHAGNEQLFPNATFHLQRAEMSYATGPAMAHRWLSQYYEVSDIAAMLRRVHAGGVQLHRGDAEIAPGITVHRIGGHTMGMQVVRVGTARGAIVLASDASHFYANILQRRPFPILLNVADELFGYDTVTRLAASPAHVIPGHDPLVLTCYPAAGSDLVGWVARLDHEPDLSLVPSGGL